jgi:hypothetical protein
MQQESAIIVVALAMSNSSTLIARAARALIKFTGSRPGAISRTAECRKEGFSVVTDNAGKETR